jgi:hypothetical protein
VVRVFIFRDDGPLITDNDLRSLRNADVLSAFGMAATVGAAILLVYVIRRLTRRQQALLGASPPA